ncbi:MAG: cytochrome c oxidase subunit II [Candidatus Omnitrophica bacterium]|nr:cytochrome c oxidase subunit II [Candidatus Omnitrophota bacterium]MBI2174308.1 cytochrome c oxidase subunit II [Candidatus Omnitrophota bacterium]MBI3010752.1 cytochrome c oxidase subunit II [Candidatus Omnitrophota bacterium]
MLRRFCIRWIPAFISWLVAPSWVFAFSRSGARVWLPEGISTVAPEIDRLFYIVLVLTSVVFVLVQGTLLVFLVRYRRRPGRKASYSHGNYRVEVVWTLIPAIILIWLAFQNQRVWSKVRGTPPPADLEVEVTAEQFAWNIRYAGQDGAFNTQDDVLTINQLHLPIHQTILIHLKSKDVIHSFFVPQFRFKQDVVPGLTTHVWLSATKSGQYEIACAELCGLGHYRMRGFLTVESPEAFTAWLAEMFKEQTAS